MDSKEVDRILEFSLWRSLDSPQGIHGMFANPSDALLRGLAMSASAAELSSLMVVANGEFELPTTFPELERFPVLCDLHLERVPAEGFARLGKTRILERLFADHCDTPPDLRFAREMSSLREITVINCSTLRSLDGIEHLPNIAFARFVNCPQLADLHSLGKLHAGGSLVELQVSNTAVADLAPIGTVTGLQRLNILCSKGVTPKFGAPDEARLARMLPECVILGNF